MVTDDWPLPTSDPFSPLGTYSVSNRSFILAVMKEFHTLINTQMTLPA